MAVLFPTRAAVGGNHHTVALGEPLRARPCRCDNAWVDIDDCVRCGRLLDAVIAATWRDQARRMARTAGGPGAGRTNGQGRRSRDVRDDYPDLQHLEHLRVVA